MTNVKSTVHTSVGDLTMARHDTAMEFVCGRCPEYKRAKKAKNVAIWQKPDGTMVRICNGCYGEILSKEH